MYNKSIYIIGKSTPFIFWYNTDEEFEDQNIVLIGVSLQLFINFNFTSIFEAGKSLGVDISSAKNGIGEGAMGPDPLGTDGNAFFFPRR